MSHLTWTASVAGELTFEYSSVLTGIAVIYAGPPPPGMSWHKPAGRSLFLLCNLKSDKTSILVFEDSTSTKLRTGTKDRSKNVYDCRKIKDACYV